MAGFSKVAKEQGRDFYENVVKPGDTVLVPAKVLMVCHGGVAHLQIDSVSAFGRLKTTGLYMSVSKLAKGKEQA